MVNPGVVLLITFAIVLTIGVIILLTWAAISYYQSGEDGGGGTGAGGLPACSTSINISDLLQIPPSSPVCFQNGNPTSFYYIGDLDKQQFDYVVAPFGTQPFDVCIGFCTGFTGGTCSGPPYNGQSAQQNFTNCMSQLSSTICSPPKPIAAKGAILYYAFSPTCIICDGCGRPSQFTDNTESIIHSHASSQLNIDNSKPLNILKHMASYPLKSKCSSCSNISYNKP